MPPKSAQNNLSRKTALLLGGGPLSAYARLRQRLTGEQFALIICADSGIRHAAPLGVAPTHIVGDFDSAGPGWEQLSGTAAVHRFSADKDKTDLHLAAELALAAGASRLVIAGATGGRLDHMLGNVLLLPEFAALGVEARLLDDFGEAWVAPQLCRFHAACGQTVSLLPLTERVTGVTVRGLRYELDDATLAWGMTLGISNEGRGGVAEVRYQEGTLLIAIGHPAPDGPGHAVMAR